MHLTASRNSKYIDVRRLEKRGGGTNKEKAKVTTFLASEKSIPLGTSVNGLHLGGVAIS
jgi:hypothetical protein